MGGRVHRGCGRNYVRQWCLPCVQQTSVLAMQKPLLGSHRVKTPLYWKHHFTEPPPLRYEGGSFQEKQPIFYVAKPLQTPWGAPHHQSHNTALLKSNEGCFCVPEHPLLPHSIALPQPKSHKCNTVSSYTFSFCCLFSLLYTTVLAVILIPSATAFPQLQTHQGAGKDMQASEERGSLS